VGGVDARVGVVKGGQRVSDITWRRSDDWVGSQIEDGYVMVNINTGKYVALNRTADAIWKALETPRTAQELCDMVQAQFDIAATACARSVASALETMRGLELATAD
jgi:formylmethanofuran dehydrogenase subunit C